MTRINHVAPYFMPLFCSRNPTIVVTLSCATASIFIILYILSFLLPMEYSDPDMFNPNAQDYFRTSLLGFLSPFLFYFLKTFIFNVSPKFLLTNILFDVPLNDSFLLCILIGLAYPQLQDQNHQPGADAQHDPTVQPLWHIIPRQSYIFGLNWALSELVITILDNISSFKEVSIKSILDTGVNFSSMPDNDYINLIGRDNDLMSRNNITLSKCVGLRRISSTISTNVYSQDQDIGGNYGSMGHSRVSPNRPATSARDGRSRSNSENGDEESVSNMRDTDSVLIIDPKDNSLRLTTAKMEDSVLSNKTAKPIFARRNGYVWLSFKEEVDATRQDDMNQNDNQPIAEGAAAMDNTVRLKPAESTLVHYYCELQNNRHLIGRYFIAYLLILSSVLVTIGQCFILSMYFIYIRGHEDLFTDIVNYFGSRSLLNFFLCVIIPFLVLDFAVNTFGLFWSDMEIVYGSNYIKQSIILARQANPNSALFRTEHFYFDIYSRATSQGAKASTSSAAFPSDLFAASNTNSRDVNGGAMESTPNLLRDPLLLELGNSSLDELNRESEIKPLRKVVRIWQHIGTSHICVVATQFFWGLAVFITGIYTAADI